MIVNVIRIENAAQATSEPLINDSRIHKARRERRRDRSVVRLATSESNDPVDIFFYWVRPEQGEHCSGNFKVKISVVRSSARLTLQRRCAS